MEHPDGSPAVKVGIMLSGHADDVGEWLADGAAFDTAGADALWVDLAEQPHLDPLAMTAALAAVTVRALLVASLPEADRSSPSLARRLATIEWLSHGRLRIRTDAGADEESAGVGSIPSGMGIFRRISGDAEVFEHLSEPGERWIGAPVPDGRAAWRATVLDAAERGFRGLLVPAEPRLLDILRNPGDPGDRRDLQLAQG